MMILGDSHITMMTSGPFVLTKTMRVRVIRFELDILLKRPIVVFLQLIRWSLTESYFRTKVSTSTASDL